MSSATIASRAASFGGRIVGVEGRVPLGPQGLQLRLRCGHLGVEAGLGGEQIAAQLRVVLAHLLRGAHLFELHVQLEGLFQQVLGDDLLLGRAGGARGFGGGLRLLLQLHALQLQQVLGARDGVFQGAIGVVEPRAFGERGGLLLGGLGGEAIGMQPAAERVKALLQRGVSMTSLAGREKISK